MRKCEYCDTATNKKDETNCVNCGAPIPIGTLDSYFIYDKNVGVINHVHNCRAGGVIAVNDINQIMQIRVVK